MTIKELADELGVSKQAIRKNDNFRITEKTSRNG